MKNIALVNDSRFDVMSLRKDFPVLARMLRGKPLAYLDNGASAQRPTAVIDAVDDYERRHHANIHRGVHTLSQEATGLYEAARDKVLAFLHAASRHEVIFVRGTTEAINLVAQSYLRPILKAGDEILTRVYSVFLLDRPWRLSSISSGVPWNPSIGSSWRRNWSTTPST